MKRSTAKRWAGSYFLRYGKLTGPRGGCIWLPMYVGEGLADFYEHNKPAKRAAKWFRELADELDKLE